MDFKQQRWQQILDGKHSWGLKEDAGGNAAVFLSQYILPLRELRDEGLIERLIESSGNRRGRQLTTRIDAVRPRPTAR